MTDPEQNEFMWCCGGNWVRTDRNTVELNLGERPSLGRKGVSGQKLYSPYRPARLLRRHADRWNEIVGAPLGFLSYPLSPDRVENFLAELEDKFPADTEAVSLPNDEPPRAQDAARGEDPPVRVAANLDSFRPAQLDQKDDEVPSAVPSADQPTANAGEGLAESTENNGPISDDQEFLDWYVEEVEPWLEWQSEAIEWNEGPVDTGGEDLASLRRAEEMLRTWGPLSFLPEVVEPPAGLELATAPRPFNWYHYADRTVEVDLEILANEYRALARAKRAKKGREIAEAARAAFVSWRLVAFFLPARMSFDLRDRAVLGLHPETLGGFAWLSLAKGHQSFLKACIECGSDTERRSAKGPHPRLCNECATPAARQRASRRARRMASDEQRVKAVIALLLSDEFAQPRSRWERSASRYFEPPLKKAEFYNSFLLPVVDMAVAAFARIEASRRG